MQGMGALRPAQPRESRRTRRLAGVPSGAYTLNEEKTPYKAVISHNNFYELGTGKSDPADNAGSLKTRPWAVAVEGEVSKPGVYDIDSLLRLAPLGERDYRKMQNMLSS